MELVALRRTVDADVAPDEDRLVRRTLIPLSLATAAALAYAATTLAVSASDPIFTIAGNGRSGFAGDGGPATSAQVSNPVRVAVDERGGVFIADAGDYRVRMVSGGVITTIAGTGAAGSSGDGGPAAEATLNPEGIAVDQQGNIYISDQRANRVREISHGTITTFAGTGTFGSSGDGGPASAAQLASPSGIAVDDRGNVFIADAGDSRIREVSQGIITTVAGTGVRGASGDGGPATAAELEDPVGVAIDRQGNLYIAEFAGNRVRKVQAGVITTLAGTGAPGYSGDGGAATAARLSAPADVAVDPAGDVYIADQNNNRIRKVTNGTITTIAGTGKAGFSGDDGPASAAELSTPTGLAVDSVGNLYIADFSNNRVRKITAPAPGGAIATTPPGKTQPLVKLPGATTFISLTPGQALARGTVVDVSGHRGIALTNARHERMTFYGQAGSPSQFAIVGTVAGFLRLRLVGGDPHACVTRRLQTKSPPPKTKKRVIRSLWGNGKGRFGTDGRYAVTSVRGTWWLIADRCDGTLVSVKRGTVIVRDLVRRKTVLIRAGHSYVAQK